MSRKRFSPEEIVNKLRQADVELAKGQTISAVCKQIGVTDQTYLRWRKEYGGLEVDQPKRITPTISGSEPFASATRVWPVFLKLGATSAELCKNSANAWQLPKD